MGTSIMFVFLLIGNILFAIFNFYCSHGYDANFMVGLFNTFVAGYTASSIIGDRV